MALQPDYGTMKAPTIAKKAHKWGSRVVEVTRQVISGGSVTNQDIPRLLSMKSINQLTSQTRPSPTLLPAAVYRARLNALAICRNYGLTPGRMVTTTAIANKYGNKLTEVAINDCAILQWSLIAEKDQAWIPLKCEWFDNRVTYHEYNGLVLIESPAASGPKVLV